MTDKEQPLKIERHSLTVRVIHWAITLSVILLIISGLGQMPMYKRYMIDQLPGMAWSSNFYLTLNLHYLAAVVLMFAAVFHLFYHFMRKEYNILPRRGDIRESILIIKAILSGNQEPPSHKYLAEQRLAYIYIVISITLTILTGAIKVLKNLPQLSISSGFLFWVTTLHNIATLMVILGIVAHLGAFIISKNRKLLPSMFTGKVDLEYVKERHSLWYNELYPQDPHLRNEVLSLNQGRAKTKDDNNIKA